MVQRVEEIATSLMTGFGSHIVGKSELIPGALISIGAPRHTCIHTYKKTVKNVFYKQVFSCRGLHMEQESSPLECGSRSNQTYLGTWPDESCSPSLGTDTLTLGRSEPLPTWRQQLHMAVLCARRNPR